MSVHLIYDTVIYWYLFVIPGQWDENSDDLWVLWTVSVGPELPWPALQLDCSGPRKGLSGLGLGLPDHGVMEYAEWKPNMLIHYHHILVTQLYMNYMWCDELKS